MRTPDPPRDEDDAEISVLIKTLRVTDQRLEELTAGEVDTVTDRDGHSYLLRRAQNDMRYRDTARQAAMARMPSLDNEHTISPHSPGARAGYCEQRTG